VLAGWRLRGAGIRVCDGRSPSIEGLRGFLNQKRALSTSHGPPNIGGASMWC